jgi:hypothetical protein
MVQLSFFIFLVFNWRKGNGYCLCLVDIIVFLKLENYIAVNF